MNKGIHKTNLIIRLMVASILVVLMGSCNSIMKTLTTEKVKKLGVYDKTIPEEQLVTLLIPFYYTVNSFDGEKVKWKGTGATTTVSMIKIPAGKHTILYKYKFISGGSSLPKEEIRNNQRVTTISYSPRIKEEFEKELEFNFEAGKVYIINDKEIEVVNNTSQFRNLN